MVAWWWALWLMRFFHGKLEIRLRRSYRSFEWEFPSGLKEVLDNYIKDEIEELEILLEQL